MKTILPLLVALPLGAGFLCPVLGKFARARYWVEIVATVVMVAMLAMSVAHLVALDTATVWVGGWNGGPGSPIGISLVSDGMAQLMVLTINLIGLLALVFSLAYMRRYTAPGLYYGLFLLMVAGMNAVVLTGDLFNLYVFLEVAAISSYALVAFGTEEEELEASLKYLVLGGVSSVLILLGIAIVYNLTGHLNMAEIAVAFSGMAADAERMPAIYLAAALLFIGFGLKAAMVPLHAWLPDAHPSAPAPISAMLSGVLIKAVGVYVIARLLLNVLPASLPMAWAVMVIGVASMVIGVFMAVGQWDFKRLLAYHSISQMGYVVLAVGLAAMLNDRGGHEAVAALALFGGLFHLFNHAVFKSLLFLCSGAVEYATGTRQLKYLGGVARRMPVTAASCRIAALSISGVPPFNGFWSKLIIVVALVMAQQWALAAITVFVSFMTLLSFAKVQRYVIEGEPGEAVSGAREAPVAMCVSMVLLAGLCLAAGLGTPIFKRHVADPAVRALQAGQEGTTPYGQQHRGLREGIRRADSLEVRP